MIVIPHSYSPETIARRFEIIDELLIHGASWPIIYDKAIPFAAVIEADVTEINGQLRHRVVATLEMARHDRDSHIFSVRDFWQDTDALQVEGVVVDPELQDMGLATALYESLVLHKGITLMSDPMHYESGKALWKKIARTSQRLTVFILDTEQGTFYPYDGSRIRYDGNTIPEEAIWSAHPDASRAGVILIAEEGRKHKAKAG
ncbi:hypothetical protein [Chimaeribacter californicus]|nr:hypothetical protein [Chimaeribacter californicus]